MDFNALRSLAFTAQRAILGVVVTVASPGADPVVTRGIWLPEVDETYPAGRDFQRRDPRRILALPVAVVGIPARGATVVAPAPGGTENRSWKVDGVDQVDGDQVRVQLTPVY